MVTCSGCGEEYPDFFPECPSCGTKVPTPPKKPLDVKKGIKGLIWIAVIVFLLFSYVRHRIEAPAREAARQQEKEQRAATARADSEKRAVAHAEEEKVRAKERAVVVAAVEAKMRVAEEKRSAIDSLDFDYRLTRPSPNTMAVTVRIKNRSQLGMKDFVVTCDLSGPSGSTIKTTETIVRQQLFPGQSIQPSSIPLGFVDQQATKGSCRVTSATF